MRKLLTFLILASIVFASSLTSIPALAGCMALLGVGNKNCGVPGGGGGGGGVTWAYKTTASGGAGTTTGVAIGPTISSDIVVFTVSADVGVPTSMTVTDAGGTPQSAALAGQDNSGVDNLSIWYLSGVTLGATSTVVITASGGSLFNSAYNVGVISGSSHPTPTFASTPANFSDPTSISGAIPAGGIGVVAMEINANPGGSWTNATQESGQPINPSSFQWMAHTAIGTGATIAPTHGTGGNQNHLVMGIWGP
jgi:hypothetical protein